MKKPEVSIDDHEKTQLLEIENILDHTNSSITETTTNQSSSRKISLKVTKRPAYTTKNLPTNDIDELMEAWPNFNVEKVKF